MVGQYFKMAIEGDLLRVGFGEPAQNDVIVKDVVARLKEMIDSKEIAGGPLLKINGPTSLPVAVAIVHGVLHLYETIAVYDPKLPGPYKYVVSVSHGPMYQPGDKIE